MIKKYYKWRVLTDDGLLKIPQKYGPYYDEDDINNYEWRGFETENDALESFKSFHKKHPHCYFGELVLIITHHPQEV